MKKVVVVNQKGGVGKTTTVINLSVALAQYGKEVLVIDFDPQGNATGGFGIDTGDKLTIYEFLMNGGIDISDVIIPTRYELVDIIPSDIDLVGAEIELLNVKEVPWETILRARLAQFSLSEMYDYVFLDTPPSLGVLTVNALVAADSVLVPVQCEYFALEGLSKLLTTIELVKESMNKNLYIEGILMTLYDKRVNLSSEVVNEVRKVLGSKVYATLIPRSVRFAEAPSYGKAIIEYAPESAASNAYMSLAKEFLLQNGVDVSVV